MSENTENKYFTLLENVNHSNKQVLESNEKSIKANENLMKFLMDSILFKENSEDYFQKKGEELKRIIGTTPTHIELKLIETKESIDQLRKRVVFLKQLTKWTFATLTLAVTLLLLLGYFSFHWYKSSIRTKAEVRQEIFQEIQSNGDIIVKEKQFEEIVKYIQALKIWMKARPNEAKEFLKFKEGFDARR